MVHQQQLEISRLRVLHTAAWRMHGNWDRATQQRVNDKLRVALDAVRARGASAPPPVDTDHSSAEALQSQLSKVTKELAYWQGRVACCDSAQNEVATPLLRQSAVWSSLLEWLSTPEAHSAATVRSGLGLLTAVMQTQDGASPVVWAN